MVLMEWLSISGDSGVEYFRVTDDTPPPLVATRWPEGADGFRATGRYIEGCDVDKVPVLPIDGLLVPGGSAAVVICCFRA